MFLLRDSRSDCLRSGVRSLYRSVHVHSIVHVHVHSNVHYSVHSNVHICVHNDKIHHIDSPEATLSPRVDYSEP